MLGRGARRSKRRRPRRRGVLLALLVTIALADTATLAGAAVLHARRLERVTGANAVALIVFGRMLRRGSKRNAARASHVLIAASVVQIILKIMLTC